jgi:phage shock protein PspC (stress-responsive transcriptional regulator)
MKKNISINIGGIIFHIEEDGYERLKEYLDSINKYFSTFEDSSEIIADIEGRIAEIFLAKLNEGKQVITVEDVGSLISTMGSIQDFQAVEESDLFASQGTEKEKGHDKKSGERETPRKLYRDGKRKLLGGVASGIAHYFSIDPLWIRLIFVLLVFDVFLTFSVSSILILSYIIMWIVLPESRDLPEDKKIKKLYRNPDDRVLGGIASGVAAYFGADVVVVRLLFVLSIPIGGILVYIILWIILPEATTITDKVLMKGEPVTLSNIESNIKSSLNVKEGEENLLIKILLFPFRLIAMLLEAIARILGPLLGFLVDVVRIVAGVVFSATGVCLLIALTITLGLLVGMFSETQYMNMDGLPIDLLKESFPVFGLVAAFIAAAIPALAMILGGIAIIIKKRTVHPSIGWSLFAIWMISIATMAIAAPGIITEFRSEGNYVREINYDIKDKIAVLDLNETGMDDYHVTMLRLRGHDGDQYRLVQEFESRGRSRKEATDNAQMIEYNVQLQDSVLLFDSNIQFKNNARFRNQRLNMTLYIPYNQPFIMTERMQHIIYNTLYRYDYRVSDIDDDNRWIFTREGLECTTCGGLSYDQSDRNYTRTYSNHGFTELRLNGPFQVFVSPGEYSVEITGSQRQIRRARVNQSRDRLSIIFNDERIGSADNRILKVNIVLPELEQIRLSGKNISTVNGFTCQQLKVQLDRESESSLDIQADEVLVTLLGKSRLNISGHAKDLDADIGPGSEFIHQNFTSTNSSINYAGKSAIRDN